MLLLYLGGVDSQRGGKQLCGATDQRRLFAVFGPIGTRRRRQSPTVLHPENAVSVPEVGKFLKISENFDPIP